MVFPRDGLAGGTWIAMHEQGNAMVLLNGADRRHEHRPPYRRSRGLIFLDIFNHPVPSSGFLDTDLEGIEAFTLVIWEASSGRLWQARWDGKEKRIESRDPDIPQIWSSAMLYDPAVIRKREVWFQRWLQTVPEITSASISAFHEFAGDGDEANDLRMNRDGILQTVSISHMLLETRSSSFYYHDLLRDSVSTIALP